MENDVSQPLLDRGKSMLDQLLRMTQTRLEMLSLEIQREKLEIERSLRLAAAVLVCAWLSGFSLILWIALALPRQIRSWLLGGLFVALLAASIVCWLALRRRGNRQRMFSRVIEQLQLDRTSLGSEP
jgi:uncharacterized membrane protein YqjE